MKQNKLIYLISILLCMGMNVRAEDKIRISDEAQLRAIADDLTGSYILANDIVLTQEWMPIGIESPFKGVLDGDNHIIYHLTISGSAEKKIGFFAQTEGAIVQNLGIENATITSEPGITGVSAGILIGEAKNTVITHSYIARSRIESTGRVGSFAGRTLLSGALRSSIDNSYSTADIVTTSGYAGGIFGIAENADIEKVYYSGSIEAVSAAVGGVVGMADGSNRVSNCIVLSPLLKGNIVKRIVGRTGGTGLALYNNYARKDLLIGQGSNTPAVVSLSDVTPQSMQGANMTYTFPEYTTAFPHYTEDDRETALSAFNTYYLLTDKYIYRAKPGRNDVAAIWVQAIYFDMIMNAYKRTDGATKYRDLMEKVYQGNYNQYARYNFDNQVVWFIYDDIMWWVIALGRAYELTGDEKYLNLSKAGFQRVWSGSPVVGDPGSYDAVKGGMFWAWNNADPSNPDPGMGKMSCINYPTVIGAMTLYNATKEEHYLDKAKEIYEWSHNNLFDASAGRVADSKHGNGNPAWSLHVYNQATCIGAAMMLYKETGERHYLDDAILTADYVKNRMSTEGFLPFETGIEQGIYNAIFAQYIIRLIEDGEQYQYLSWLWYNIDSAWGNRNTQRNITYKDHAHPAPSMNSIESYDASGIPAFMQVISPEPGIEKEIDCHSRMFYEKNLMWDTENIWVFPENALPVLKYTAATALSTPGLPPPANTVSKYVSNGNLFVSAAPSSTVEIFNISGIPVKRFRGNGSVKRVELPQGVYIVKVKN